MGGDKDKSKISGKEMEMDNLSLDTSSCSRDFLTRFMGSEWRESEFEDIREEGCDVVEEEEIELSLGLSLGGRLGVDNNDGSNKLIRSSSTAECLPMVKHEDDVLTSSHPPIAYSRLVRTTSLPLGNDEELKKRKELQTLRRMEAKRRRSEKQRNLKGERDEGSSGGPQLQKEKRETHDLNLRNRFGKDRLLASAAKKTNTISFGADGKGKGVQEYRQKLSQGSVESQRGGSSSVESQRGSSELDNRFLQSSCGDTNQSLHESSNQVVGSSSTKIKDPSNQSDMTRNQIGETRSNTMEDMPCVFTKGDGPNGRRVDGILYKYGRGEEVRIMCVCHGSFHSPAEFVKHAGGTDITHPLKHIVINPNSTPLI